MKIIKSFNKASKLMKNKIEANNGCNICPYCNETIPMLQYLHKGIINRGIMGGIYKSYATGIFKTKYMKIDCYSCLTCGQNGNLNHMNIKVFIIKKAILNGR